MKLCSVFTSEMRLRFAVFRDLVFLLLSLSDCSLFCSRCVTQQASRAQILDKATEYIQYMRRKNHTHQQDIDDLKRQNALLEQQGTAAGRGPWRRSQPSSFHHFWQLVAFFHSSVHVFFFVFVFF